MDIRLFVIPSNIYVIGVCAILWCYIGAWYIRSVKPFWDSLEVVLLSPFWIIIWLAEQ